MSRAEQLNFLVHHIHESKSIVWCRLDKSVLNQYKDVPTELIGHARLILAGQKSKGLIEEFQVYPDHLELVWEPYLGRADVDELFFILGIGIPHLKGLSIKPPAMDNHACSVSIKASPEEISTWHYKWLVCAINMEIGRWGGAYQVNEAQVKIMCLKGGQFGLGIKKYLLDRKNHYNPSRRGRPFWVRIFKDRREIEVILGDIRKLGLGEMTRQVNQEVAKTIDRLAVSPQNEGAFKFLKGHLKAQLEIIYKGPAQLGLGLPISLAGGFSLPVYEQDASDPLLPFKFLHASSPQMLKSSGVGQGVEKNLRDRYLLVAKPGEPDAVHLNVKLKGYLAQRGYGRPYCLKALDYAKEALKLPSSERHFEAMTLCLSEPVAHRYFQIIKEFKIKNLDFFSKRGDQIWQLNFQSFPLTRLGYYEADSGADVAENTAEKFWCFLVMREMVGFRNFSPNPEWIARKLYPVMNYDEITSSLGKLVKMGLIKKDRNGWLIQTTKSLVLSELGGTGVIGFHKSVLDLARRSSGWDIKERSDNFAITFQSDPQGIAYLKKNLLELLQTLFEQEKHVVEADQIYQVSFQLFPLK